MHLLHGLLGMSGLGPRPMGANCDEVVLTGAMGHTFESRLLHFSGRFDFGASNPLGDWVLRGA